MLRCLRVLVVAMLIAGAFVAVAVIFGDLTTLRCVRAAQNPSTCQQYFYDLVSRR